MPSPSRWFGGPGCVRGCWGGQRWTAETRWVVAGEGSRSGWGGLQVWPWPLCKYKGRPESWMREGEGEEGLSRGRSVRERSPQPGIPLSARPRERNHRSPRANPGPGRDACPRPGAQGRGWLSASCGQSCCGAPPRQQTWERRSLLPQTVAVTEAAGGLNPSTAGLARHQPLQTPQTTLPLLGHVLVSFHNSGRSWEDQPESRAPRATERPGAPSSLFSQGWGWALPAASPQIQAEAAAAPRVPDWPRQS